MAHNIVKILSGDNFDYLVNSRKDHRLEAISALGKSISSSMIDNCTQWIKEEFEIIISKEDFLNISELYPYKKVYLVNDGYSDSSIREAVAFMICNFFADSRMISYGDTNDDKQLQTEFYKMIKDLAKDFGYKII